MANTKRTHQSGFSLVIAAVILMALGTVTAFMIRSESATSTQTFNRATYDSMEKLWGAIEEYAVAKGRFPCPASLTTPVGSDDYGKSVANCNSGTPVSGVHSLQGGDIWRGMVPVKTIGVPIDWAIDRQGNRIVYVVSKNGYPGSYNITVEGESGPIGNYDFILMNMGIDGMGAYSAEGSAVKSCVSYGTGAGGSPAGTVNENVGSKNCGDDGTFLSKTIEASNTTEQHEYYDDTVMYTDGTPLHICMGSDAINWSSCTTTAGSNAIEGSPAHFVADTTLPVTGGAAINCTSGGWNLGHTICSTYSSCATGEMPGYPTNVCDEGTNISTAMAGCTGVDPSHRATGTACGADGARSTESVSCCRAQCTPVTINWSQGANNCSASSGAVATYGDPARAITDSSPSSIGSATITCQANGTWNTSGASCTTPTCPASQTINWSQGSSNCSASSGSAATYGAAGKSITDSSGADTGSVTITCNSSGNWVTSGGSCTTATPSNCSTATLSWGSGNCSASFSGISHGATSASTNNTASGYTGSATATCTNGTWSTPSGTCSASGGGTCSWNQEYAGAVSGMPTVDYWCGGGAAPGVNPGATCTTSQSNDLCGRHDSGARGGPTTGRTYRCDCPATSCSTSTLSWGSGCSASFSGISNGSTSPSTNNTASGYTGSATATCSSGTWSTPSGTCSASGGGGTCNPGDTSPGDTVACDSDDDQALDNCGISHGVGSTDYVVSLGHAGGMCGGGDPLEDYKCCKTAVPTCSGDEVYVPALGSCVDYSGPCPEGYGSTGYGGWEREVQIGSDGHAYCYQFEDHSEYGTYEVETTEVDGLSTSFSCYFENYSGASPPASDSGDPSCGVP